MSDRQFNAERALAMGTDTTDVLGVRIPLSTTQHETIKALLTDRERLSAASERADVEVELCVYISAVIGGSPTPDARGYLARLEAATEFSPAVMVLSPEPPDRIECELEEAV